MKKIILEPIGAIQKDSSEVIIEKEHEEALDGIEDYSHIIIIFWLDKIQKKRKKIKKIIPYGIEKAGRKGVFSTRMPFRPNPIGITTVRLIKRKDNILKIEKLDAFDGTPVLDIKPYNAHPKERIKKVRIPNWEKEKHKRKLHKTY